MEASELIGRLVQLMAKHGDVQVDVYCQHVEDYRCV